jgi:hypothetical protein
MVSLTLRKWMSVAVVLASLFSTLRRLELENAHCFSEEKGKVAMCPRARVHREFNPKIGSRKQQSSDGPELDPPDPSVEVRIGI